MSAASSSCEGESASPFACSVNLDEIFVSYKGKSSPVCQAYVALERSPQLQQLPFFARVSRVCVLCGP